MKTTFFVTGVNGVGKTTVIKELEPLLGAGFEIHDFDERGVPDNVGRQWRLDETNYWIELGGQNSKKNITTVICGFAKPSEINDSSVGLVLLDADKETIEKRLWNRYQTPESIEIIERVSGKPVQKFIDDNAYYSSVMREEAKQHGVKIVDTTPLNPEQVAREVSESIKHELAE